jgi:hypothetical protein
MRALRLTLWQIEMKCIYDIEKNISLWAKVSQVSDVTHGPLVVLSVTNSPPRWLTIKYNASFVHIVRTGGFNDF